MTRWIADFEVEGHVCVRDKTAKLRYVHSEPPYEVHIRNLKTEPGADPPLLSVQVISDAGSASDAAENSRTHLKVFLDTLAFVTNAKYSIRRLLQVADWSPGLKERDCVQYQRFPGHDLPIPGLNQSILDTVAALHVTPLDPRLRRALKWFALGVSDVYLDDQFQHFWFVLEIAAEVTKNSERVPDRCQRCKAPLLCPTCNETPTHRPFPKQAIRQLIERTVPNDADKTFEIFLNVRNALLHGEEVTDIEAAIEYSMDKVVNIAGHVAWKGLLNALAPAIAGKKLNVLQTNIYTHDTLSAGVVMKVGAFRDPNDPQIDELPKLQISMTIGERDTSGLGSREASPYPK